VPLPLIFLTARPAGIIYLLQLAAFIVAAHLGIDSAVGNDLGIALCDRREYQHAGTVLG
jgi:hypothetical protein